MARRLEREKVDLIYTEASSVTIAVKRATTGVPIVFAVGSDPVVDGLVEATRSLGGALRASTSIRKISLRSAWRF